MPRGSEGIHQKNLSPDGCRPRYEQNTSRAQVRSIDPRRAKTLYGNIIHLASNYRGFSILYPRNWLHTLPFGNICTSNDKTCHINNNFSVMRNKWRYKTYFKVSDSFLPNTELHSSDLCCKANCLYTRTLLPPPPPPQYHIILGQQ
jgi:hypothetical protein